MSAQKEGDMARLTHRRVTAAAALLIVCILGGGMTLRAAAQQAAAPAAAPKSSDAKFLRVVEENNKSIALQIASRDFVKPDGTGPRVGLIAVAHIADRSFYRAVEKLLKEYDVVLFESVKPPGTGGAGGSTDQERIESTRAAMGFIGGLIETYKSKRDAYPADLSAIKEFARAEDARLSGFIDIALRDAWGRQLVYELHGQAADQHNEEGNANTYTLISLGADGKVGGEGVNADVRLADQSPPDPLALSKEDGLQSQLADALGLEFQLDALPYDEPNWRCSDMAIDEVSRRLRRHGADFEAIGGTLAGTSLPAQIIKVLLAAMRLFDSMMEGALTDTFKVVMIEILGDERLIEQSMAQFGPGFGEVIVQDRNQVAIDDLKAVIQKEPQVKSVAVLYGAAHMPDMSRKLAEQLGYAPVGDAEPHWLTAIRVDLTKSRVSPSDVRQIRLMIKQAIRQQMQR
jgi:hypothetical protein